LVITFHCFPFPSGSSSSGFDSWNSTWRNG